MRRIFAIWTVCLCWGILDAAPLGPFNATLLEQLRIGYQKGDEDVVRYIEFQEKAAEKYIKMPPLSVTAKKKLPPSKDPRDYMVHRPETGYESQYDLCAICARHEKHAGDRHY